MLLERVMLAKSLKHFIREWLTKTESAYFAESVAHIFNLVFSPISTLEKLETKDLSNPSTKVKNGSNSCRKNGEYINIQNEPHGLFVQKNTIESFTLEFGKQFENSFNKLKKTRPSELWERLREICQKRYLYNLPENIKDFKPFKYRLTKLATLRDVCLSGGIILECTNYELMDQPQKKQDLVNGDIIIILPFRVDNIFDATPIVKHLDPSCDDAKSQIELVNYLV